MSESAELVKANTEVVRQLTKTLLKLVDRIMDGVPQGHGLPVDPQIPVVAWPPGPEPLPPNLRERGVDEINGRGIEDPMDLTPQVTAVSFGQPMPVGWTGGLPLKQQLGADNG